jgi:manganese-dependent inorganic pyrophosphatase
MAKLNLDQFAQGMFRAKSELKGIAPEKLITKDYKEFKMGKYKVGIGVFETVDPTPALNLKEKIFKAIPLLRKKQKLDFLFFGVVDIIQQKTYVFVDDESEEKVISQAFGVKAKEGITILEGVVSRKKQIIPPLERYFEKQA